MENFLSADADAVLLFSCLFILAAFTAFTQPSKGHFKDDCETLSFFSSHATDYIEEILLKYGDVNT